MKARLIVAISLAFFLSLLSNAQYSDFDLSKYKLPDIKTSSMDLELDLNHNVTNNRYNHDGDVYDANFNRNFGGDFITGLYHFRNSANYQGSHLFQVSYEPNYIKSVVNDSISKDNKNMLYVYLSSDNKFYNNSSAFFEVQPYFYYRFNKAQNSEPHDSEKTMQNYLGFSVPVSVGYGRIEPVGDARLAIYILDELSKQGRIVNQPDEEKILELASVISKIKRKRFFDTRIRKIAELQTIDSFLVANHIVSPNDMVYFTRLNDQWDYASGPSRNSGFSISLGCSNNVSIARNKSETTPDGKSITRTNAYIAGGYVSLQYSDPLNLHWQSDLSLDLPYNYVMTRVPKNDLGDYNTHRIDPEFTCSINYLPNSRTSVGLYVSLGCQFDFGKFKATNTFPEIDYQIRHSGKEFYSYTAFNMYYYFSPQLRLQVNWSLNLRTGSNHSVSEEVFLDEHYKHNLLNNGLSVRLIYSFF